MALNTCFYIYKSVYKSGWKTNLKLACGFNDAIQYLQSPITGDCFIRKFCSQDTLKCTETYGTDPKLLASGVLKTNSCYARASDV